jgi:uncharacterized protein (TIGR00299 family) protein
VHVHLDAIGGVAGDMFLAALLDARPDLTGGVLKAIRAAGLPKGWTAEAVDHLADGLSGRRFHVLPPAHGVRHHDHPHEPHHHHVAFRDIRAMIVRSALDEGVKARAVAVFRLLAEAEGAVHGKDPEDVHFHEVADWDSVADIVGAAFVIEALGGATWSVSALPLGGGRVKTAHGILPVPAPATARLLEGFETVDDGIAGERITPTGAAILKALAPTRHMPSGAVLAASGTGFGTRVLSGLPNILRALMFETDAVERTIPGRESEVAVVAFEVDDQTPEDLAAGLDKLRAEADVLDVTQAAVLGKKGRMMAAVQILCRAPAVERVAAACFAETTTIGLRWHLARRFELDRRTVTAGGVRVKVASRPGGPTAKAEMDDIREIPGGHPARAAVRDAAEADAVRDRKTED